MINMLACFADPAHVINMLACFADPAHVINMLACFTDPVLCGSSTCDKYVAKYHIVM